VDFAEVRLPLGWHYALVVLLGYSRLLWLQYYERQTMAVLMRALESAFAFVEGVAQDAIGRFQCARHLQVRQHRAELIALRALRVHALVPVDTP
jgi:hypothetical protein